MTRDGKPEPKRPRLKKSETLEVRIPYETKQAFLAACREDGTTASEIVRAQVQSYLDARVRPSHEEKRTIVMQLHPNVRRYGPRVAAGGIAAMGLTALAVLPSAADPDFKAQFSRLDANGDGQVSEDEFLTSRHPPGEKSDRNVVIETHSTVVSSDGAKPDVSISTTAEVKQEAYTFWLPEELSGPMEAKAGEQQHEYKFVTRKEVRSGEDGAAPADAKVHTYSFSVDDLRKEEFASIDANKDGKVSLDEYGARQTAMLTRGFDILDANADKSLTQDEYAKIVAPPVVKMNWQGGPDMPEPPKIEIPGMKAASPEAIKAAFSRLDTDKDDKLSLQEYLPKT
jgi:Ca2+-binding EF-hand superfamily protein